MGSSMGFVEQGSIAAQSGTSGPCGVPSPLGPSEGRFPSLFPPSNNAPPVVVSIDSVPICMQTRPVHILLTPCLHIGRCHGPRDASCDMFSLLRCAPYDATHAAAVIGSHLAATSAVQHLLRTLRIQRDVRLPRLWSLLLCVTVDCLNRDSSAKCIPCAAVRIRCFPAVLRMSWATACRYFVQPSCKGLAGRVFYAPAVPVSYGQYSYAQPSGHGYSGYGYKTS